MKDYFQRLNSIIVSCSDLNGFHNNLFSHDVLAKIVKMHTPQKRKFVRGNHSPFVNKTVSKEF